jgi:hypothetical protein
METALQSSAVVRIAGDKMNSFEAPTDYFEVHGYRNLVMSVLSTALRDITSSDKSISNSAKFWFDPVKGNQCTVRFIDCVALMGCISRTEAIRDIALSGDKNRIMELVKKLDANLHIDPYSKVEASANDVQFCFTHDLQLAFR